MKVFSDILVFGVLVSTVKCTNIQIAISDGRLRGTVMMDYDNGTFYSFTRIPYAKSPIGEYRFKLAEKNEPWKGILDATQPPPSCSQPNKAKTALVGQEDCLFLNVFTKSTNKFELKPVMVYIHGGGLVKGSSADYGTEFLMTEDIVLVTINYRLGVYGFINTVHSDIATDAEMFGNNGFKDQVLALKWVQRNIQHFGGNPRKVTIAGQSAGGMAVHIHMLSSLSAGLFHQAIAMGGSALSIHMQAANNTATPLAKYLGLDTTKYDTMMQGLRDASNEDLFNATKALKWFEVQLNEPSPTGLVIEKPGANSLLSDYPLNIIKHGNYKQVPLMIGSNNRGGLFIYGGENVKDLATNIPFYFHDKPEVMNQVRQIYNLDVIDGFSNLIDFYTHIWYIYQVFRAAREHVKVKHHKHIYFYQFSGDGKLNFEKSVMPSIHNLYGAAHADELGYLFNTRGLPTVSSLEERLMRNLVKTIGNFARNGKPLRDLETFQENVYNYVNITNNGLEIGVLYEKSFEFWDKMYNNYSNDLY